MMTTREKLRYSIKIVECIVLLMGSLGVLAGCGVKDSAVVIPIGEVSGEEAGRSGTDADGEASTGGRTGSGEGNSAGESTADGRTGFSEGSSAGESTAGGRTVSGEGNSTREVTYDGKTDSTPSHNSSIDTLDSGKTEIQGADGMPDKQEAEPQAPMIYIYVCGCVNAPGVVELPEGSRAEAALEAAGGFTEEAWCEYVNLAAVVTDGEKLYFPRLDEAGTLPTAEQAKQAAQTKPEEQAKQPGLVNVNTADLTELTTLPGIGESRAKDIIAYREKYGNFEHKEDLKKISGIKESVYSKLEDKITVN